MGKSNTKTRKCIGNVALVDKTEPSDIKNTYLVTAQLSE
jgi:hypothetical protein